MRLDKLVPDGVTIMTLRHTTALFLILAMSLSASAQQTQPSADDEVVKITSKLVQLDVVVTDKDGNQVTDLSDADFEIFQDGKTQKITSFSYIGTGASSGALPQKFDKKAIVPPTRVRPGDIGRVITFIVDDGNCLASLSGMRKSRDAIEKFVKQQMLPNDFVAIYQTRSGSSMFQQYTSDKARLLRAASKVRWYPSSFGCASNDGSFWAAARENTGSVSTVTGKTISIESAAQRKLRENTEDSGRNNQVVGTIGVLRYVVRGLDRIPGRKVVFFMSDGMPFIARDGKTLSAVNVIQDLTDQANRSSVVFNTIDVRGLFDPSIIEAGDAISTIGDANATAAIVDERSRDVRNSQDGLSFLAGETGGKFYHSDNDLGRPIAKALSIEKGYYLLAYVPDDDTFKGKNFNKINVRSKRPGLRVSSRSGFVGVTSDSVKPKKRTGDSELYEAIVAPLPKAGMNLTLTAFSANTAADGNFVRSLIHLQGDEVTFTDDANGMKKAIFDVVAVTLSEKNQVVDEFTRSHTLRVEAAAIPLITKYGVIYSTDVPVKKPGIYNFRVAVRDVNSKLLGSASQMVQIPEMKEGKLFLSGLTIAQVDTNGKFPIPAHVKPDNALAITTTAAVPAIRHVRPGAFLGYSYTIYNAKLDRATGQPKLTIQTNLFYNGEIIIEGPATPAELESQPDWSRVNDYGYLRLDPAAKPGDYALQVIVRDLNSSGKNATVSQWIDFEVKE